MKLKTTVKQRQDELEERRVMVKSGRLADWQIWLLEDFAAIEAELKSARAVLRQAAFASQAADTEGACGACDDATRWLKDHPE